MWTLTTDDDVVGLATSLHDGPEGIIKDLNEAYGLDLVEDVTLEQAVDVARERGIRVEVTEHKVEVLVIRDPDDYTEVEVYLEGRGVDLPTESIDPGAGHLLSGWREGTEQIRDDESYSPEFRDRVVSIREEYNDSQFIENDEEEQA